MKVIVVILALFFSTQSFPQSKQFIYGNVSTVDGKGDCFVSVNDTLGKFDRKNLTGVVYTLKNINARKELLNNSLLLASVGKDGSFNMNCKKSDSLTFSCWGYVKQTFSATSLINKKGIKIVLKRQPCEETAECKDTVPAKFYAFIAERLSITPINTCEQFTFNDGVDCRYKVIKNLYGNYKHDTANFKAYYHEGPPSFARFKYIIVFVSEYCGQLYQEKYQFFDVYQTKNGRWASPGDPYRFDKYIKDKVVKAVPLSFDASLSFDTAFNISRPSITYEEPYFETREGKAYPLMGAYAEDLFEIKKDGVLKARKIFPRVE
jgi:hypothetical protein